MTDYQQQLSLTLRREMRAWTDEARVEFLDDLTSEFCRACGREKEAGEACNCTNDE